MITSEQSIQQKCQTFTALLGDSHVSHGLLPLQAEKVLEMIEEIFSLKSSELLKLKDLKLFCLKTCEGFSVTKRKGSIHFRKCSFSFHSWGIIQNSLLLTANSMCHKTGKGSLAMLQDVLEENPDPRYFLSEENTQKILMEKEKFLGKIAVTQ